jgi:hypothetical protein
MIEIKLAALQKSDRSTKRSIPAQGQSTRRV